MSDLHNDKEHLNQWSHYEASTQNVADDKLNLNEPPQTETGGVHPRRGLVHRFFILYGTVAGLTTAMLGLGHFLALAIEHLPAGTNEAIRYCISMYLIGMCGLLVFTELEWFSFITGSRILTNWISRGMAYVFMSLLSIDQASLSSAIQTHARELQFIRVTSYMLAGIGAGYIAMGVLCGQLVLNKCRKGYAMKKRDAGEKGKLVGNCSDIV
mmetsp:Transcript_8180/g.12059  ORF Transcript_8180/g.12059 Transcript_8180/m.12059 type:complete len:212 (+) Transcript_8180:66-701(+)